MKHFLFSAGFLLSAHLGMAQAVTISGAGESPAIPNPNAILSIQSASQGLQLPSLTSTARMSMGSSTGSAPAPGALAGIVVFDNTTNTLWYNSGTNWINLASGTTTNWLTTGNAGTVDGTNFLGTTDNIPLTFRVNNQPSGRIDQINQNTFFGYQTGVNNAAFGNSAYGYQALFSNTSGINNLALGWNALFFNTTGSDNVAIGISALNSNTTSSNLVAIGDSALFNNTQIRNTAVGSQALFANTSGGDNTAVGYGALENNNTGGENSAFGSMARTGSSGSFNTVIGFSAQSADGITDAAAIGSNANVATSNTIQLGDRNVTAVNSFGTFNTISDGRFKFNIREDVSGLDFIMKLRPVTYQLDTRKIQASVASGNRLASYSNTTDNDFPSMHIRRTGFIAQEVEKAADETGFNFDAVKRPQNDKDHYSLSYEEFVVPLVKAVQEQQRMIDSLGQKIMEEEKIHAEQKKVNDDQEKKLARLQQEIDEINKQKIK